MTTKTRVVHVKDQVPGAVYIGRAMPRQGLKASPFANPFKIGKDGSRDDVLRKYENQLRDRLASSRRQSICDELFDLIGKPLACWCRKDGETLTADNRGHGDILASMIDALWPEGQR